MSWKHYIRKWSSINSRHGDKNKCHGYGYSRFRNGRQSRENGLLFEDIERTGLHTRPTKVV